MPNQPLTELLGPDFGQAPPLANFSLDTFVDGEATHDTYAKVTALVHGKLSGIQIIGGTGSGKSHLLYTINQELPRRYPGKTVCCLSGTLYLCAFKDVLRQHRQGDFEQWLGSVDVLLLDDLDDIIGSPRAQVLLARAINAIRQRGGLVCVTGSFAAEEKMVMELQDTLRTHAIICTLTYPGQTQARAILEQKLTEVPIVYREVEVSDEALDFMAELPVTSVRELTTALQTLLAYTKPMSVPASHAMAVACLSDFIADQTSLQVKNIQTTVCEHYGITHLSVRVANGISRFPVTWRCTYHGLTPH